MKKVGILTEYYESLNYGGVLQAYALCHVLNDLGFEAEQISYHKSEEIYHFKQISKKMHCLKIINPINVRRKIIAYVLHKKVRHRQLPRKKAFDEFRKIEIPHTEKVFNESNLHLCNEFYDAFIVGSDQVWNPDFWHPGYMLNFVDKDKIKIAYAASLGVDKLTSEQENYFRENLFDYNAISVRESNAINLLSGIVNNNIELVLDPVLLLSKTQWENLVTDRIIQEKYIFTYFLGDSNEFREIVKEYALEKKMKIVALPHIGGFYRACDRNFGNYQLYDVSPQGFISLIRNADIVFTDSFHATAFSGIFQKEFIIFQRDDFRGMGGRLHQVTKLFNAEDHFCVNEKQKSFSYINNLKQIDYDQNSGELLKLKNYSINFLKNNLT